MSKVAFVFPGQGSQTVGMMKEFYEKYQVVRDTFAEADAALGYSIKDMCFEGPEEELRLTKNTQPAILTCSVAALRVLQEQGIKYDVVAGHSLGEYSALVAAGSISLADAVKTVHKRGEFMQEAVPVGKGSMAAIIAVEADKVKAICAEAAAESGLVVQAVNFNCPGQIVIAGDKAGIDLAVEKFKAAGAKKAVVLPVSAPFHSALMQPAADKLAVELANITIKDAEVPVFTNVTAQAELQAADIKGNLVKQAAMPVLWEDTIKNMLADGVTAFVEVGPGKVLTGFNKRINKELPLLNVEDEASLEKVVAYFKEVG